MNFFKYTLIAILTVPLVHAADIEIYGTSGVTSDDYAEPNVIFIVDTSGSMQGSVEYNVPTAFNPNIDYARSWEDEILENPNYEYNWGWERYAFDTNTCGSMLTEMDNNGFANANALQDKDDNGTFDLDESLKLQLNRDIKCYPYDGDTGFKYTFYSPDYAHWLREDNSTSIQSTRMNVIRDVITDLADSIDGVRLGLMRFNGGSGGRMSVNVATIEDSKGDIKTAVAGYTPGGGTPLTEALHEAAQYFRGGTSTHDGGHSGNYTSPISAECQKNHVILFTDGEASSDTAANSTIRNSYISGFDLTGEPTLNATCGQGGDETDGGCLEELAYWMRNTDHAPTIEGDQVITVHTIGGFGLESAAAKLDSTAHHGGGNYYAADDAAGIAAVITRLFENILETDTTFTAPAVSVNAFNTSEHRDELFYALFSPADNIKWAGNLKRYKLNLDGKVVSRDGTTEAIDPDTGYFAPAAHGFWNPLANGPDGPDVSRGGMANLLDYANRTIYTESSAEDPVMPTLRSSATTASFVAANTDELDDLVDWAYGENVGPAGGNRYSIGDPLHSEPVIVTYSGSEDDPNPDSTIFFGTNEGYIHAVDTVTGAEEFAFIPRELHSHQKTYFQNTLGASEKPYGMDGLISTWFKDLNNNNVLYSTDPDTGAVTLDAGEHVYLYAGMRRGGRNYYALDVTDKDEPKFLFSIKGDTNTTQGDFRKLGQTWSKMQIAKVKFKNLGDSEPQDRFVLFFTGGYDVNQDSNSSTSADSIGNAVYMVDATDGTLLWWASNEGANLEIDEMNYSMPATPSLVDHDGDGYIDYFFAADMGGQLFRFDINPDHTGADNFVWGGAIASVAGSTLADKRRFYNKPDVSLVKDENNGDYLAISLGSGHRAHPKSTTAVNNHFYVFKNRYPYSTPPLIDKDNPGDGPEYNMATLSSTDDLKLSNVTTVMNGGGVSASLQDELNRGAGFYVTLSSGGEKVLADSFTFYGAVLFSTFKPNDDSETTDRCGANLGQARLYALNVMNGKPILSLDGELGLESSNLLSHSGIPPRPVVIYRSNGKKSIATGTEVIDDCRFTEEGCEEGADPGQPLPMCEDNNCYVTPLYWRQNDKEE